MFATRLTKRITPKSDRIILQYFNVGSEQRIQNVVNRILSLPENEVIKQLEKVLRDFSFRHLNFKHKLLENYKKVEKYTSGNISHERKLLIGAYFSKEYSIESASLFNPSIVPHPDQSHLKPGMLRFIISLRATGEGHLSSIEFRSGVIDEKNEIYFDETSRFCDLPGVNNDRLFEKNEVVKKLNPADRDSEEAFRLLPEAFTHRQAKETLEPVLLKSKEENTKSFLRKVIDYTNANYEISFNEATSVSERVIFPYSVNESVGMEDARFVRFTNDDGEIMYYGTYTAYNGRTFGTQLIETKDFLTFKINTMHGNAVNDKGMALFPRKVKGKYVISSRQGGENLQIMYSDDLYYWNEFKQHRIPVEPWEFVQLGNCGSPLETSEGWLLITHAVGPFRKYSIGAVLLDLDDPSKIIGRLKQPLLEPLENEREGYVPNVVYSCGSIIHNNELIVPYAMSDSFTGFARISMQGLLAELKEKN